MALLKIIKAFFLAIYTSIMVARQTDKIYNKINQTLKELK